MRCRFLSLVVGSVALPHARGFVQSSFTARPIVAAGKGWHSRSRIGSAMKRRSAPASRERKLCSMMEDRLTDEELEYVQLDLSSLDAGEKERVEGIRAIQSRMLKVDAQKGELRIAARAQAKKEAEAAAAQVQATKDGVPASVALPIEGQEDKTEEELWTAQRMASIEQSLSEVDDIQRQLGISVEEEDESDIEVVNTAWRGQASLDITEVSEGASWGDVLSRQGLAAGDVLALTLFAYIGRASHGMEAFDLGVLATALPFIVGWLVFAPFLGAYTAKATADAGEAAKSLVPAWAVSIPAGIFLRALSKGGEIPPIPFAVTSMIFTFVSLLVWRELYTAVNPTGSGDKKAGILDGFRMITTLLQRW